MEVYKNPALSAGERASDLLKRMTPREKIGQLTQRLYGFSSYIRRGDDIEFTDEFKDEVAYYGGLGALYGLQRADPWSKRDFENGLSGILNTKAVNMVQSYVISHSRFGIPALISTESPRGAQVLDGCLLPVNLAVGCAFSPESFEKAAKTVGRQLKMLGVDLALVSALDILRDPRWGRSEECYGEDPYLAAQLARAVVRGIQSEGVDVVVKHLCAQGESTGGINASAAGIGERELREIHLPAVKACIEEGVCGVMAAYNEIDGVYCHANKWLLTGLLREEYGFKGIVMSDGLAVDRLDAVTGDRTASGALALNSGVDMGLWDTGFKKLEEALEKGLVSMETIDRSVKRVLTLKFKRGLFENPYIAENEDYRKISAKNSAEIKKLTEESLVLIKNEDGLLPLNKNERLKIGLIGPNANSIYNQLGDYSPPVREGEGVTLLAGLKEILKNSGADLITAPELDMFESGIEQTERAVKAVENCDVIIAAVGGSSSRFKRAVFDLNGAAIADEGRPAMDCGEGVDSADIGLPGVQIDMLKALRAAGKPVITVLTGGRPYAMREADACSNAIICAFYPGLTGGEAVAKLIFGECEPAGRLSVTLPDEVGQLPVYYNHKDSYRAMNYYNAGAPKYRFGAGLSYTSFIYSIESAPESGCRAVGIRVKNTGRRAGFAVPQLYIHREQGITTARTQLCAFKKLFLMPGEEKSISLVIPDESLVQYDSSYKAVIPAGKISWFVADNGEKKDGLCGSFLLQPCS